MHSIKLSTYITCESPSQQHVYPMLSPKFLCFYLYSSTIRAPTPPNIPLSMGKIMGHITLITTKKKIVNRALPTNTSHACFCVSPQQQHLLLVQIMYLWFLLPISQFYYLIFIKNTHWWMICTVYDYSSPLSCKRKCCPL